MIKFHRSEMLGYNYEVFENKKPTQYFIANENDWWIVFEGKYRIEKFGSLRKAKEFIINKLKI